MEQCVNHRLFERCLETLEEHNGVIDISEDMLTVSEGLVTHIVSVRTWDDDTDIRLYNGHPTEDEDSEALDVTPDELNKVMDYVVNYY